MHRFDVIALGELVIDLVPAPGGDRSLFAAMPGGAPGNVAAGIARLGLSSAVISRIGPGALGELPVKTLHAAGVVTDFIARSDTDPTALAVVSLNAAGDRDFVLYRDNCADGNLAVSDLPLEALAATRILHVGSLSLATPRSAAAQREAVRIVHAAGGLVSADVNFRPALWRDLEAMRRTGLEAFAAADIAKVSTEELQTLAGIDDIPAAVRRMWHDRLRLLAVTQGEAGATLFTAKSAVAVAGFAVPVVDTVGCGDAFMASLLAGLLAHDLQIPDDAALREIGRHACAAGAVMASVAGAMAAMPQAAAIDALLRAAETPIMAAMISTTNRAS